MTTDNFSILVVCTANQCRSPMAEFLFRTALYERGLGWQVSSAGTNALPGLDMHPHARRFLERRDTEIAEWYTTPLDEHGLASADLVLTMTRQQRSLLTHIYPAQRTKVIPILGFARLLPDRSRRDPTLSASADSRPAGAGSATTAVKPQELVVAAADLADTPLSPTDDLADPVGQPYRRFKACADALDQAIDSIFGW